MKRLFPAFLVIIGIIITGCGSGTSDQQASIAEGETASAQESTTEILDGEWIHSNSETDSGILSATISDGSIQISWILDDEFYDEAGVEESGLVGNNIYWVGSFDSVVPAGKETVITSTRDKVATDGELLAADTDTKDFSYHNGAISFPISIQGNEATVELERATSGTVGAPAVPTGNAYSFADRTFISPTVTFKITSTRVIPVGEVGNESGDAPVLAFFYETTNNGTETVDPLEWFCVFSAVQDNDPNMINELDTASHPDPQTLDTQLSKIKPGGTVPNAVGYYLTDTTTPVDLIASTNFGATEIGQEQFPVH